MTIQWLNSNDAKIAVQKIESVVNLNNDGSIRIGGHRGDRDDFRTCVHVIQGLLKFHPDVPVIKRHHITDSAILKSVKQEAITPDNILLIAQNLEKAYLKQPQRVFVLLTTVSIRYSSILRTIQAYGSKIIFSETRPKNYAFPNDLGRKHPSLLHPPPNYTWIRMRITARCEHSAIKKSLDILDRIRGSWNLAINYHSWEWISGPSKPINKVLLGPLLTLHFPRGHLATDVYWWQQQSLETPPPYDITKNYNACRNFERSIHRILTRSQLQPKLENILIRYCRALDEWNKNTVLLSLWSILEELTGTGRNDGHDTVVKKALMLEREPDYTRIKLNHMRRSRNNFVHEGESVDDGYVMTYQLKMSIETLFDFLVSNTNLFKSMSEYRDFLSLPLNLEDLKRRNRIHSKALKIRTILQNT